MHFTTDGVNIVQYILNLMLFAGESHNLFARAMTLTMLYDDTSDLTRKNFCFIVHSFIVSKYARRHSFNRQKKKRSFVFLSEYFL